ncbi:TPA: hypothetical protein KH823_001597 [Escherichia coli]|uniref:hypothetical protein n=1 Tax=Escherichia coli TaxID=562 RepID=UPI001BA1538F|nr:hypothetical protein [Escherichia coli]HBD1651476.1 hypothetical protein [Escherichia coli]HCL8060143.1 hypothetical protein [Escherichia coli]HCY2486420.1 hypothetical protein [Escherichia coli]HDP6499537.1 hypothetical protein [Escherichia coli]
MNETTDKEKTGNLPASIYCGIPGHSGFVAAHNYLQKKQRKDENTSCLVQRNPSDFQHPIHVPPPRYAAPLPFADIFYPSTFSQDMHVRDEECTHDYCPVSPVPGKNSNQHLRCYSTKRVYIWGNILHKLFDETTLWFLLLSNRAALSLGLLNCQLHCE